MIEVEKHFKMDGESIEKIIEDLMFDYARQQF